MARMPWTKFQDFYLRLGFLKVLVAILDPNRRSAANEMLSRRLQEVLYAPARGNAELWERIESDYPWFEAHFKEKVRPRGDRPPSVLEGLLLVGDCPSQLYGVTEKTAYKILDWARDFQMIGAGNQISENGVLLRSLLPKDQMSAFLQGKVMAWNPFVHTTRERLFLLFHLCEIDQLTIEILTEIASAPSSEPMESATAAKHTCRAFFRVLEEARDKVGPAGLPALRRARELASAMAEELELGDLVKKAGAISRRRLPKPPRIPAKGVGRGIGANRAPRRTTKNSDHQTIPRFEQLVDLGFLAKPINESDQSDPKSVWESKRRWRYEVLPACRTWVEQRARSGSQGGRWEWRGFASAAVGSGLAGSVSARHTAPPEVMAELIWAAYERSHRQVGHTPFESVAVMAMIESVVSGSPVEIEEYHEMLLAVKAEGLLKEHAFFASGNEIDKMFLLLRPGFIEAVREESSAIEQAIARVRSRRR